MILPFVIHENTGDVLRVVEIAHRAEWNHHHTVVVVVAPLHFMLINSDHLKTHPVNTNALPQSLFAGEKFPLSLVANHDNTRVLDLVLVPHGTTAVDVEASNALIHRVNAG